MNSSNKLINCIVLLPFAIPEFVYYNPTLSSIMKVWKILVILYILLKYSRKYLSIKCNNIYICYMLIYIGLVGILDNNLPFNQIYQVSLLILFTVKIKAEDYGFLKSYTSIAELFVIINVITVLLYPNGMYTSGGEDQIGYEKNWFLGYKNPMVRFMLPACVSYFYLALQKQHTTMIRAWIFYIICFLTTIMVDSSTGAGGLAITGIIFFLYFNKAFIFIKKQFTLRKMLIITLVIDFMILVLNSKQFSFIIENIFNRQTDFTGRTEMWEVALFLISKNPIWGYGSGSSEYMLDITYGSHPHNFILYILLQGGVIALTLFIIAIWKTSKTVHGMKNFPIQGIILGSISAFLIMGITESMTAAPFIYTLFAYHYCPLKIASSSLK